MPMRRKPTPRVQREGRAPQRSPRWEAQRRTLIAAAQSAIRKKGPTVSMDDIAAEAHVAKPILYRHFGDRAGLARAVGESILLFASSTDKAEMLKRLSAFYPAVDNVADLQRVLQGFVGQFATFVEMDTDLYRFLQTEQALQRMMQDEDGGRLRSPVAESLTHSLATILDQHGLESAPAALWANALVALASGAIEWWAADKPCHRFELEKQVLDLAWYGISGLLERQASTAPSTKPTRNQRPKARRQPRRG